MHHTPHASQASTTDDPVVSTGSTALPRASSPSLLSTASDLLLSLQQAVRRVEIANEEGDPILSAWLPEARAVMAKAMQDDAAEGVRMAVRSDAIGAVLQVDLRDANDAGSVQRYTIAITDRGIAIRPAGYADRHGGEPILIETLDGTPRVVVWSDQEREDYTHLVELTRASDGRRACRTRDRTHLTTGGTASAGPVRGTGPVHPSHEPNAALHAAAPDLLEALQQAVATAELRLAPHLQGRADGIADYWLDAARAAIARAAARSPSTTRPASGHDEASHAP